MEASIETRPVLLSDRVLLVCLAALGIAALPFVLPILPRPALESFSLDYVDMVHLATATVAFGWGLGRMRHLERRRFATFMCAAFVLWAAVRLSYVVLPFLVGTLAGDVATDLLYLLFYLALILAAESKPHLASGWSRVDPTHKIRIRGTAVFAVGLLGYFVLIPSTLNYAVYGTWLPSLYMYLALDVYVALRFIQIRAGCKAPAWRRIYGMLIAVTVFWAVTDLIEALSYAGIVRMPEVGPGDLLWWLPYPLLVIAGRYTHRQGEATAHADDDPEPRQLGSRRAIAPQVVMAFVFPGLHVGLYGVGLLDVTTRAPRDILVLAVLVTMGLLILVQQLTLEQRNRRLATDLDDARARLSRAQRMEAVGRLAGGIAHDFNNLLTAIQGHTQLMLARMPHGDRSRSDAAKIDKASQRAANLTRQLLAFSRRQVLQPKVIDLNEIVRGIEEILDRLIGEDIRVVLRLQPEVAPVLADPAQLEQVVMNLVINARDAMPQGGELTLLTEQPDPAALVAPGIGPGDWIALRVRDTGEGMRDDVREQAFEPFFTTKERGTGLGLSTVYGIVTQSGGRVGIESHSGQGTTVTIALPRVADVPAAIGDEREPAARTAPARRATVLLAEDEPTVRALARDILEARGYRVIEAPDGRSALDLHADRADEIELLLTDVVMPHMGGVELARELRRRRPGILVVYMSGYSDAASLRDGALSEGEVFLAKPFSPDALVAKVQQLLASRESS